MYSTEIYLDDDFFNSLFEKEKEYYKDYAPEEGVCYKSYSGMICTSRCSLHNVDCYIEQKEVEREEFSNGVSFGVPCIPKRIVITLCNGNTLVIYRAKGKSDT